MKHDDEAQSITKSIFHAIELLLQHFTQAVFLNFYSSLKNSCIKISHLIKDYYYVFYYLIFTGCFFSLAIILKKRKISAKLPMCIEHCLYA